MRRFFGEQTMTENVDTATTTPVATEWVDPVVPVAPVEDVTETPAPVDTRTPLEWLSEAFDGLVGAVRDRNTLRVARGAAEDEASDLARRADAAIEALSADTTLSDQNVTVTAAKEAAKNAIDNI